MHSSELEPLVDCWRAADLIPREAELRYVENFGVLNHGPVLS